MKEREILGITPSFLLEEQSHLGLVPCYQKRE